MTAVSPLDSTSHKGLTADCRVEFIVILLSEDNYSVPPLIFVNGRTGLHLMMCRLIFVC